jgi:pimeloyl-ACP methyl ester carboxylesterase/DNA-binding CsgD family transcriptional regulator
MAEHFRTVHYDSRGQGMSARGLPGPISTDDYYEDLETIIDAAGFDRFALVGYGGFGQVALRYAAKHMDRVTAIVLICSSDSFEAWSPAAHVGVASENWELFLDLQTSRVPQELKQRVIDFITSSTTQTEYLQMVRAFISGPSVAPLLPLISVPTLLIHSLDQHWLPPADGARLAANLPNARILFTDGDLEPAENQAVPAIVDFLSGTPPAGNINPLPAAQTSKTGGLSGRQIEVLAMLAEGKRTREIAEALVLSDRTVERHIAGIYEKIGARNRSEATAFYLSRPDVARRGGKYPAATR